MSGPHKLLAKTEAAAAEKNPEFQVEVIDEKEIGSEHGTEAGMSVEGDLGKKDEGIEKLLKSLEPATWGAKGMPKLELSEAEKAERKRKAEDKQKRRTRKNSIKTQRCERRSGCGGSRRTSRC